ncbi:uncharacterized protein LOC129226041 isoform X2 [Uloborus diversus]|uniref:uncharacterized protein LOC129226041 isoform X2 n=1 Tax=Uloborus diversus TaxID=327109 RepID=UPI002409264E|nr:uncharacterized protein LOC129226041 isoform X2 [Uloborus diversus]
MKPECIKFLLDCYLYDQSNYSGFEEVDGFAQKTDENAHISTNLSPEQELVIKQIANQMKNFSSIFEKKRQTEKHGNFLQFKEGTVFVPISQGKVTICVSQEGDCSDRAQVHWKTSDGTAKSGFNFISNEGELFFSEGEKQKTVEVKLLNLEEDAESHFSVELFNSSGITIGPISKLTVFITNNQFDSDEKETVEDILRQGTNVSFVDVISTLKHCVTPRTFQTALQFLCGSTDSIPIQLTFACELAKIALSKTSKESVYNVVSNFFRDLPEAEEVAQAFF